MGFAGARAENGRSKRGLKVLLSQDTIQAGVRI